MKRYVAGRVWAWVMAIVILAVIGLGAGYMYLHQQPTGQAPVSKEAKSNSEVSHEAKTQPKPTSYTSRQGIILKFDESPENAPLSSPYTLTGQVPGNWSFEASFPVELVDSAGTVLAQAPAKLQGDWMTTDYVPFSVTVEFRLAKALESGRLILRKDNPSGLAENSDEVIIPVRLRQ